MAPQPRCVIDRSRPCGACIAPGPDECPYVYLLADDDTLERRYGGVAPGYPAGGTVGGDVPETCAV